jgi:tRNA 2-selenouridine synthase
MGLLQLITINQFLSLPASYCLIDVRSEAEFDHAHIPQAQNLPILNNEERKLVGTTYKQKSKEDAIKLGLEYFGPKLNTFITKAEEWSKQNQTKTFVVYCWRGGLRSKTMAWLLNMYGFDVFTIQDGYKAFRTWCLQQFEQSHKLIVLGGFTGSNKTKTLHHLQQMNEPVIDLEALASHKGSAFGQLGMPPQPSTEMFENKLALQLYYHKETTVWIEAESPRIGKINLPLSFFEKMKQAIYIKLDIPFEQRLELIINDYGFFDKKALQEAIERIKNRLGGLATQQAIEYLHSNNLQHCFGILLQYYDKYYEKSSNSNHYKTPIFIKFSTTNALQNAQQLLQWKNKHLPQ